MLNSSFAAAAVIVDAVAVFAVLLAVAIIVDVSNLDRYNRLVIPSLTVGTALCLVVIVDFVGSFGSLSGFRTEGTVGSFSTVGSVNLGMSALMALSLVWELSVKSIQLAMSVVSAM